jgi:putative ABC transport system permease protein
MVGVLDKWNDAAALPSLIGNGRRLRHGEEFFIPFSNGIRHEYQRNGSMSCTGDVAPGLPGLPDSECTWIQGWIETRSAGDRAELQSWLDNYAIEQRKLGRLKRAAPNMLYDVRVDGSTT